MKKLILTVLSVVAVSIGCQKESKDLSYQFEENGCNTGKVSYSDDADKCNALKSDSRNNNCARGLRYQEFQSSCPGQSWN